MRLIVVRPSLPIMLGGHGAWRTTWLERCHRARRDTAASLKMITMPTDLCPWSVLLAKTETPVCNQLVA